MLFNAVSSIFLTSVIGVQAALPAVPRPIQDRIWPDIQLSSHTISLENRYPVQSVSQVFKDNILLNMAYMRGYVRNGSVVDWNYVREPFIYQFILKPGETFAFHDTVFTAYQNQIVKTSGAHFNAQEGFLSDGYLYGDGVCHLASLISWSAKDAGLTVLAPTNHNFANIPEVPKEQGVSIYSSPYELNTSATQNLYITNNRSNNVVFVFKYDGTNLSTDVMETK
jgi:hypothetical protein